MTGATDLAKLVPGFEFLQNLMKGAGASIPGMSQWIAPTLDPILVIVPALFTVVPDNKMVEGPVELLLIVRLLTVAGSPEPVSMFSSSPCARSIRTRSICTPGRWCTRGPAAARHGKIGSGAGREEFTSGRRQWRRRH